MQNCRTVEINDPHAKSRSFSCTLNSHARLSDCSLITQLVINSGQEHQGFSFSTSESCLILNLHILSYFTLSQFDDIWCLDRHLWHFFQKLGMQEAATRQNIPNPFYSASPPVHFPPSLPCPQNTPLSILPQHSTAFQSEYCRPFRKFDLSRFGSAFSPTAAWLGRTSMASRHLRVIRAPIMKSKPVAIPLCYVVDISMRLAQIGDQAFGLAVTDLIQDLYPYLRVGPASVR